MTKVDDKSFVVSGHISVDAVLRGKKRKVNQVWFSQGIHRPTFTGIKKLANERSVMVQAFPRDDLTSAVGNDKHGDVLAWVEPRKLMSIPEIADPEVVPYVVMLDGVEDPFNYGQSLRALFAAGIEAVLVRQRSWQYAEDVVLRASAGAYELMDIAEVKSPDDAAVQFRKFGYKIACLSKDKQAVSIYDAKLSAPLLVIVGGEKRGIKRSFLSKMDSVITIPYSRKFQHALGTVSSVTILAFELGRKSSLSGRRN